MTRPTRSQTVLAPPAKAAIFLVVTVRPSAENDIRELLGDVSGLVRAVGFRVPDADLNCVVGIGAQLWERLYGSPRPAGLHPFRALEGERHTAVSTPGDVLFHLRGTQLDVCFELAYQISRRLSGWADIVDEVHGFKFFDERDLLGFVDGTENPEGIAAVDAVTIGDEDAEFAGGSYVLVQKYLHDLDAWNTLSVEEQERAIGREKLTDIEIPDELKAPNSHVSVNTITDPDGTQLQIVRDNMPFGSVSAGEFGTYYIGYAATPDVIERMLQRMFIGEPPGNYDRILDFSTAVTGSLFYVPTAGFLDDQPPHSSGDQPDSGEPPEPDRSPNTSSDNPSDGSLAIGSLRRTGTS
ncbi:Dyp-type peroxidase [Rhodococcus triatomae]|uniref:Putative iron-dependent peroxidase n=1 Tax=Rhodococcus triatomae TaxID=300028 RepID=A0A1G8LEA7_9NOCA|nr:Dyp-type peroxidase [Rhodococcus triatomae]QNG20572.1 Dyp-type peroxidase [Rhodococcus triatomae]QNG23510.1 Dyp-type peroxidase [Rhodococcus triatomae]SDI54048.1 putative iron-dependent peroxidase [Rhodococcus triatomae]